MFKSRWNLQLSNILTAVVIASVGFGIHSKFPNFMDSLKGRFPASEETVSTQQINELRSKLVARRTQIYENLVQMRTTLDKKDLKKAEEWAEKKKIVEVYDLSIELCNKALQSSGTERGTIYQKADRLSGVLLANIENIRDLGYGINYLKLRAQKFSISGPQDEKTPEASNLLDPKTGRVLSAEEVLELKRKRFDISTLNPATNNGVVDLNINISSRMPDARGTLRTSLYQGIEIPYPEEAVGTFDEFIYSQTKPKMKIDIEGKDGKKRSFKIKLGREVRAEVTASTLANMLGLHSDPVKVYPSFRIYLGKTSLGEFKRLWNKYYEIKNVDKFIQKSGTDSKGFYLEFKNVLLEYRDIEDVVRVAGWSWKDESLQTRREMRVLPVFQAWIHNTDLKDENTKLAFRGKENPELFYLVHDVGYSFGNFYAESVLSLKSEIVKSKSDKEIVLDFNPAQQLNYVTYADARWFLRKLAMLSREQIREAVRLGLWSSVAPHDIAGLLVERLIQRRNNLVQQFDLVGAPDENGQVISLLGVDIERTKNVKNIPGGDPDIEDYGPELTQRILKPAMKALGRFVWDSASTILGSAEHVNLDPVAFGFDKDLIAQIVVKVNRNILRNPNPKTYEETYMVKDDYQLGFRLGGGLVVSGDVSLVRKHSLIYTVPTEDKARFAPRYLYGLFADYKSFSQKIPKNHIYLRDEYLEGRGRLRLQQNFLVSLGLSTTLTRVRLWRTAVLSQNGRPTVALVDKENSYKVAQELYTRLLLFDIPHAEMSSSYTNIQRRIYDLASLSSEKAYEVANDMQVFAGESLAQKLQVKRLEEAQKTQTRAAWSLLGFISGSTENQSLAIETYKIGPKGEKISIGRIEQERHNRQFSWKFLMDGESFEHDFLSETQKYRGKNHKDFIDIRYVVKDNSVKTREFVGQYLRNIDLIAGRNDFLNFSPELHQGFSNNWGPLELTLRASYSSSAVDKIAQLELSHLVTAVAQASNLSATELMNVYNRAKTVSMGNPKFGPSLSHNKYQNVKMRILGKDLNVYDSIRTLDRFANTIKKIRKNIPPAEHAGYIVKALFKSTKGSLGSLNPIAFVAINNFIPQKERYFSAYIAPQQFSENKLPGEIVFVRTLGDFNGADADDRAFYDFDDSLRVYKGLLNLSSQQ